MAENKSQKRKDRQARRTERRRLKDAYEKHELSTLKPVRVRLTKKSLPGFLAKNANAILTWLREYQTLFCLADDYGIQRLDRFDEKRRNLMVQNYTDIGFFIIELEKIIKEQEQKDLEKKEKDSKEAQVLEEKGETQEAKLES